MKLDPRETALLTLDLQAGILASVAEASAILPAAEKAVVFARARGLHLVHVGLGFTEGYPELPEGHPMLARVRERSAFVRGTPSAEFHPSVYRPGDPVMYKQRVSAFSDNHLKLLLRSRGIRDLVFFGVATSGIVLSTVRRAFDLDFRCTILEDACFDPDPEVHRVLSQKVFPRQATVMSVERFISEQG